MSSSSWQSLTVVHCYCCWNHGGRPSSSSSISFLVCDWCWLLKSAMNILHFPTQRTYQSLAVWVEVSTNIEICQSGTAESRQCKLSFPNLLLGTGWWSCSWWMVQQDIFLKNLYSRRNLRVEVTPHRWMHYMCKNSACLLEKAQHFPICILWFEPIRDQSPPQYCTADLFE